MDVVGQSVEKRTGQSFRTKHGMLPLFLIG
jgi:hypothetical protein